MNFSLFVSVLSMHNFCGVVFVRSFDQTSKCLRNQGRFGWLVVLDLTAL